MRYSPDGEKFASGGFDGKVFLYNSKDSDLIGEVGSPAHNGGVYGVCFSNKSLYVINVCACYSVRLSNFYIGGLQPRWQEIVDCFW